MAVMRLITEVGECWIWGGATTNRGYPRGKPPGHSVNVMIHRWLWECQNGPILSGSVLTDACGNRRCVKPEHWEQRTQVQASRLGGGLNVNDASECPRGHIGEIARRSDTGARYCRVCCRENARRWRSGDEGRARVRAQVRARRSSKKRAAGSTTSAQMRERAAFWGNRCWMCRGPYEHDDHVKPLAAGGSNWPANMRPICSPCNLRKGSRWPVPTAGGGGL